MGTSTKSKVLSGLVWKFSERISAQLVTLVVSIVLARLLSPEDYGAIAIVNIFIALANVFVVSGFGNSLIQKKCADNVDFSSVFYFSIVMSLVIYAILFFCAPVIADFYNMAILSPVLRVLGLRLVVAGVNSVQHAYVSKHMMFKRFFWSTLFGTLISGIVGIAMAYAGFGIWALVAQYMVNTTVDTIVLWFTVKWRPVLKFSFERLKGLFSYGWKLLASELLSTAYSKFRALIIGKLYTPEAFAFYSKGEHFVSLIVTNVNTSIQSVLFPVMSNVQEKRDNINKLMRRSIKVSGYVMFPLMAGFAVVAEDFVSLILTEKWLPCVPYLQISCLIYALMPIHTANLQAIKAMGKSDVILRLEVIKKILGLTVFLFSVRYGVWAVAMSGAVTSVVSSFINAYPNKKLLNYGYFEQIKDLFPSMVISFIMAISVMLTSILKLSGMIDFVFKISIGVLVYILISILFNIDSYNYIKNTIKDIIIKGRGEKNC